jgi:hypothetical protein
LNATIQTIQHYRSHVHKWHGLRGVRANVLALRMTRTRWSGKRLPFRDFFDNDQMLGWVVPRGPDWILEVLTKWRVMVKRPGHPTLEELVENERGIKELREFDPEGAKQLESYLKEEWKAYEERRAAGVW